MKAALYARVSSEEQTEGYSIDAQRRAFCTLCESKEWTPFREYIDEGKSARTDNINKRPEFKEAINDALAHQYDVLVVHKIDRFSRRLDFTLEYFNKLRKAGISFMSITEQMDFTSPWGKFTLSMLGGLAELYSDNLSLETKKGWNERRKQGLYCGSLPFGAIKDEDGVPVPDIQERVVNANDEPFNRKNYEGLKMIFELASHGSSDREITIAINSLGYKTTGTHGPRSFSKDTIRNMLKNRFYIGYVRDGKGGWLKGKHEPFVEPGLFEEVQRMRERRITGRGTICTDANTYSLTGLARCVECGSTLRAFIARGRVRLVCNGRLNRGDCSQSSSFLDIYERQLRAYLDSFHIPEDYQKRILAEQRRLQSAYDINAQRKGLEAQLVKLTELYKWGHKTRSEYLAEYNAIKRRLNQLTPFDESILEKLAYFLQDITQAWDQASQEHRNRLLKYLVESLWIEDKKVVGVIPQPEFIPFFDLQYDGKQKYTVVVRPRGDLNP